MEFQQHLLWRVITLALVVVPTNSIICGRNCKQFFEKRHVSTKESGIDPGEPLLLTPYIESGELEKAHSLSKVGPLYLASSQPFGQDSFAGFLTVNKAYQSNIFFWFFPSQADPVNDPVILWLQGGPGGSGMFGLFAEHGPLRVGDDAELYRREITWNRNASVIYVDNPVGTGFSYTKDPAGYATNQNDVARDLFSALTQFFTLYHEYLKNDFYVSGESYGGKYGPAITHKIMTEMSKGNSAINLKGMTIGDGFSDPLTMVDYGDYLYYAGLLNEQQRDRAKEYTADMVRFMKKENFKEALEVMDHFLLGLSYPSYFTNVTGMTNYYNILRTKEAAELGYYHSLLDKPEVRRALHVGNLQFGGDPLVGESLMDHDFMSSVKPWVVDILNAGVRTLFYNGQLDIIVAHPLTDAFLKSMSWRGSELHRKARRVIWKVNGGDSDVAGYVTKADNLYQVVIKGAGHLTPYDQPERSWDLIYRFMKGDDFGSS